MPQPQVLFAFGFVNSKPLPLSPSEKSRTVPARKKATGSLAVKNNLITPEGYQMDRLVRGKDVGSQVKTALLDY